MDQVDRSLEIERAGKNIDVRSDTVSVQEDPETIVVAEDMEQEIEQNHRAFQDYDGQQMQMEEGWVDFGDFVRVIKNAHWSLGDGVEVEYWFDGDEIVSGVQTDKASWQNNETNPECPKYGTFWVDHNGNIVKAELNGVIVEKESYPMLIILAVPPLAPFALADFNPEFDAEFKKTLAGQDVDGWDLLKWENRKENMDGRLVDIYSLELKHPGWGDLTASFRYGDFGPFKIILAHEAYTTIHTYAISFR